MGFCGHKAAVEFNRVGIDILQHAERRCSASKVVNQYGKAQSAELAGERLNISGIIGVGAFGNFDFNEVRGDGVTHRQAFELVGDIDRNQVGLAYVDGDGHAGQSLGQALGEPRKDEVPNMAIEGHGKTVALE